tara:strand:- start:2014 stop:3057 length:1044 start_codon:yes stop_codon:yes gene_type:complete
MKIAVCSDKFSGTLSSIEVLNIIKNEFEKNSIKAMYFPVTDGGESSTEILKHYGFKTTDSINLEDLGGKSVEVELLRIHNEIFFESSQLIGINNTSTSSMDLNTSCLSDVVSHVDIIGLGGSRTIDGGIGLLSKLGIEFYQKENLIENPLPKDFEKISSIKINKDFKELNKRVLVDTSIPLLGENSAIEVFGPQKGLSKNQIEETAFQLERIISLISDELLMDINPYKEGTGAAGGLSFTLSQILGCKIVSGADYFMETTGLKEAINSFEVVILCEGRFDKSSLEGKIIGELLSENNQLNYFLGGQYDLDNNEAFEGIFECGVKGLSNPEKELMIATNKLLEKLIQN